MNRMRIPVQISRCLLLLLLSCSAVMAVCKNQEFSCNNGTCIDRTAVCDYALDCPDGEDETNCTEVQKGCVAPTWFRCSTGRCIASLFRCDGEHDCQDGSDEANCTTDISPGFEAVCQENEFKCTDRRSCVNKRWLCDGDQDCFDGSDETFGCRDEGHCSDGFQCSNGHCLAKEFVCDGQNDCGDNSDESERECKSHSHKICHPGEGLFLCHDGVLCVPLEHVCDGFPQCFDQSDELGCNASTVGNCPSYNCSHSCKNTPDGPQCYCPPGMELDSGLKKCQDIDECQQFDACGHKCKNVVGSYLCTCDVGYALQDDRRSCKAAGDSLLLFASDNQIRGIYLEHEVYFPIAQDLQQVTAVSYDGQHIYWANINVGEENIIQTNIHGTDRQVVIDTGLGLPEDLVIDFVTGNLYFTDSEKKHIGVCTKDGSHCTVIVNQDVDKPRAITLLPQEGIMFWSDWGAKPMIAKAGMNGFEPSVLVNEDIHWPNGLAIDYGNYRLYWVDAKLHFISSVGLDGTDRREVLKNSVMHPFAISVFEDKLYWSDWESREVKSCNKFTGKNSTILFKEKTDFIYRLHVYNPVLQPHIDNPCAHNMCDGICLLAANRSFSCHCAEGEQILGGSFGCAAGKHHQLAMVNQDSLHIFTAKPTLGRHHLPKFTMPDVDTPSAIAFNSLTNSLLISDVVQKKIFEYNLDNHRTSTLISLGVGTILSMSHDPYTNNLYACDDETRTLTMWSLKTKASKDIVRYASGHRPLAVVVAPDERLLFVAVTWPNEEVHILKMNLNGTGEPTSLVTTGIQGSPVYLSYDSFSKRVSWYNPFFKAVETIHINGTGRNIEAVLPGKAMGILAYKSELFCTIEDQPRMYHLNAHMENRYVTIPDVKWGKSYLLASIWQKEDNNHACISHAQCSHICLADTMTYTCACPDGLHLASDNKTCMHQVSCTEQQFECTKDFMCVSRILRCDGRKDCPSNEDEEDCTFGHCRDDQFKCANGQCIAKSKACDFHFDCADRTDEITCPNKCRENEFPCGSGECILDLWVCDHSRDCADGSDERVCDINSCGPDHFQCKSGTCISSNWECDGEIDCVDGTDEHENCRKRKCEDSEWKCKNDVCIGKSMKCDGYNDCGDASDEENCFTEVTECRPDEFKCSSISTLCVPNSARCNYTAECPRGEDETDCAFCHRGEFQCANKRCVTKRWLCDGENDCGDNSDEHVGQCLANSDRGNSSDSGEPRKPPCEDFQCGSGECMPRHLACNGVKDCGDGSDEGGRCGTSCKEASCQDICYPFPTVAMCACKEGFALSIDGHSCVDIDECVENRCSQQCVNTHGSFKCACQPGYVLKNDRVTCKAKGEKMNYIIGSENEVKKISEDLNHSDLILYEAGHHILGIDMDTKKNVLYWSSATTNALNVYKLEDGSRSFISTIGHPGKISLDWVTGNAYFIDRSSANKIVACHLVDRKCTTVVTIEEAAIISDLVVDPLSGYLFYAKAIPSGLRRPYSKIYKFDKSEENATLLATHDVTWVSGMTLDHVRKVVYWADLQQQVIERVGYDGLKRELVFKEEVRRPESLSLFENSLFWLNKGSGELTKCDVYGEHKGRCTTRSLHLYDAKLMVVNHLAAQPQAENPCGNMTCVANSMCLSTPKGGQCFCEDGTLANDDNECTESNKDGFVAMARSRTPENSYNGSIRYGYNGTSIFLAVIITMLAMIGMLAGFTFYQKNKNSNLVLESFHFRNPTFGMSHVPYDMHHSALSPGQHEYVNQLVKHPNGSLGFILNENQNAPVTRVHSAGSCSTSSDHYQDIDMKTNLIP